MSSSLHEASVLILVFFFFSLGTTQEISTSAASCEDEQTTTVNPAETNIDYQDVVFTYAHCAFVDEFDVRYYKKKTIEKQWYDDSRTSSYEFLIPAQNGMIPDDKHIKCKNGATLQYKDVYFLGVLGSLKKKLLELNIIFEGRDDDPQHMGNTTFQEMKRVFKSSKQITRDDLIIPEGAEPVVLPAKVHLVPWTWLANYSVVDVQIPTEDDDMNEDESYGAGYELQVMIQTISACEGEILTLMSQFQSAVLKTFGFFPSKEWSYELKENRECVNGEAYYLMRYDWTSLTSAHRAAFKDLNIISGHATGPPKAMRLDVLERFKAMIDTSLIPTEKDVKLTGEPLYPMGLYFSKPIWK